MPHVTIPLAARQPHSVHSYGSCTNVGHVRKHNEDNLLAAPPLFAVADGMGGHKAGEVASEIAISVLAEQAPANLDADALSRAVEMANYTILQAAEDGRGAKGMGTTLTAAMLKGERLLLAQVGDSRAYLLHQGRLQQITHDHSLVAEMVEAGEITPEEAKYHPKRSVITRALGSSVNTLPDIYEINVVAGDRILLCSDGLTGMVNDSDIRETMLRIRDPQNCTEQLVKQALANGGYDNVSVVIFDVEGETKKKEVKTKRKSRRGVIAVIALLVIALGGTAFGINHWISNSAFLAESNGYVAIYKGVPGEILGHEFNELVEQTSIKVDSLNAGLATRLREGGVRTDSIDEAYRLAQEYEDDAARNAEATSADGASNENTSDSASTTNTESGGKANSSNSSTSSTTSGSNRTSNTAAN